MQLLLNAALGPSTAARSQCSRLHLRRAQLRPMAGLSVHKWDATKQGQLTNSSMLKHLRSEGFSGTVYTFPTGCEFGDHTHACDKRDAILNGKFLFRMGGEEIVLQAGDMLDVPAGKTHYAKVLEGPCVFVDGSTS